MTNTCVCNDPQVEHLRELVARGMDQWEASRLLWSPRDAPPPPPAPAMVLLDAGRWGRATVRHHLATRLPWLRLPTPSEVS
ncbi:MAG: hypothetical protein HOV78_11405 [Hamadaea sp.]|nr:hypothetical protein [Hamadaea sp.]